MNTQYTEYTQYRVPVSLPVLQNVSLPVSQNVVVHQPPQTEGMIRGLVFSPIPQTAGHSVSLPVLHNAIVQHVPQHLVQISQTEGTAVQQIPQQQVVQIPQIRQNISLPASKMQLYIPQSLNM